MTEKSIQEVLASTTLADFTIQDDGRIEVRNLDLANAVRRATAAQATEAQAGFNLFCPTNFKCNSKPQSEEAPQ